MVQIAGVYQHVRNENFVPYLIGIGFPEDKAKAVDGLSPKVTVAVDGDKVTITSETAMGTSSTTYILGQEVEEKIIDNTTLKSTASLSGDTLTISSKSDGKNGTRIYKFSDTELAMTMGEAKRFYKRV